MSKERLSKLQKWILTVCYQVNGHALLRRRLVFMCGDHRGENFSIPVNTANRRKVEASISRSLRSLYDKGYLEIWGGKRTPVLDETNVFGNKQRQALGLGKYIKWFCLTDEKGIAKAEELLNVNKKKLTVRG